MNPFTSLLDFIGSANVQKFVGLFGGPALAVELNHLPVWVRAIFAAGGPIFAAIVHFVDGYRANGAKGVVGDLQAQLPQLKVDLSKAVGFVETDLPQLKPAIDSVEARVTAIEQKAVSVVPAVDRTVLEPLVREVLAQVIGGHAPDGGNPPAAAATPVA